VLSTRNMRLPSLTGFSLDLPHCKPIMDQPPPGCRMRPGAAPFGNPRGLHPPYDGPLPGGRRGQHAAPAGGAGGRAAPEGKQGGSVFSCHLLSQMHSCRAYLQLCLGNKGHRCVSTRSGTYLSPDSCPPARPSSSAALWRSSWQLGRRCWHAARQMLMRLGLQGRRRAAWWRAWGTCRRCGRRVRVSNSPSRPARQDSESEATIRRGSRRRLLQGPHNCQPYCQHKEAGTLKSLQPCLRLDLSAAAASARGGEEPPAAPHGRRSAGRSDRPRRRRRGGGGRGRPVSRDAAVGWLHSFAAAGTQAEPNNSQPRNRSSAACCWLAPATCLPACSLPFDHFHPQFDVRAWLIFSALHLPLSWCPV
jgi:hypothetical protein